jgi:outer membrane protein
MGMKQKIFFLLIIFSCLLPDLLKAQEVDGIWTLDDCINYALKQNIQIRQSYLTNESNDVYVRQAKSARLPNLNAAVREHVGWDKTNSQNESDLNGSSSTSFSISSSLTLFNGMSLTNSIKRSELDFQSGYYNSETIKESVSLTLLDAYLQILYAEEQVANSKRQVEATTEQLALAGERLALSAISMSDYLQVKSQLANEKLTLANAESQTQIALVNLMQLMDMPVSGDFAIAHPNLDSLVNRHLTPDAQEVYNTSVEMRPQVKKAELDKESATLGISLARASYYPSISLDAALGTGYSSLLDVGYVNQLNNQINPTLSLSFNIPIYQRRQARSGVQVAEINVKNAELNEMNIRNQLRKDIEQASVNVMSAQIQYEASLDQYEAVVESYQIAEEKFDQGMINSVDFLFEKTNQIASESQLLQAKYNLIFSYKILDFYMGKAISI